MLVGDTYLIRYVVVLKYTGYKLVYVSPFFGRVMIF
jgi:hypothetical protein